MRILLVEDDRMIGGSLVHGLADSGYSVDWVCTAREADAALRDERSEYQIVLLDWGLPDRSGVELLRNVRQAGNNVPVLMITARDGVSDRVTGLDFGADDFLVKPFELAELKARIRALARRHAGRVEPILKTATLRLDPSTRCVERDGREIRLTAREYALLHALMARPGALLSRAQLEERVYSWSDAIESNAIEFLIHGLRQKIGREQIENTRGLGWRVVT